MKIIKYIYIVMISLTLVCLSSCQIAQDLDDFEPNFALDADNAITGEASAELALTGVYGAYLQINGSGIPAIYLIPSIMSGVLINNMTFNNDAEAQGYLNNNPVSVGTSYGLGAYTRMYDVINRANWLIEKVTLLSDENFQTEGRRLEILAETKALRATANFYLLRLWGQFYDTNSKYGITLRTAPSRSAEVFPRNTVAEVYAAIIADLDEAITYAPDLRAKFYTNKTYAKALKAKVLLYQGDYSGSATLAKEVIDGFGTSFALAATYGEIFLDHTTKDLFESSEVLFATKGEPGFGTGIGNFTGYWAPVNYPSFTNFALETTLIGTQNIAHDGTRVSSTIYYDGDPWGYDTFKFNYNRTTVYDMVYHLRAAEVYLIYAEADARATKSVSSDALGALNAVRIRAGATTTGNDGFETYPATISLPQFLEAVRIEKYVELAIETGEEWYDLVRYHFVDGFDVTTVKASATNPDKYILPIDGITIEVGGNVVEQNPSY